jgi:hypothetical protein
MNIKIVQKGEKINRLELRRLANEHYQDLLVGAADIRNNRVAFGGEFNHDARDALVESGSDMADIWGFKIFLTEPDDRMLEFVSPTDVRPGEGNPGLPVPSQILTESIRQMVVSRIS